MCCPCCRRHHSEHETNFIRFSCGVRPLLNNIVRAEKCACAVQTRVSLTSSVLSNCYLVAISFESNAFTLLFSARGCKGLLENHNHSEGIAVIILILFW